MFDCVLVNTESEIIFLCCVNSEHMRGLLTHPVANISIAHIFTRERTYESRCVFFVLNPRGVYSGGSGGGGKSLQPSSVNSGKGRPDVAMNFL